MLLSGLRAITIRWLSTVVIVSGGEKQPPQAWAGRAVRARVRAAAAGATRVQRTAWRRRMTAPGATGMPLRCARNRGLALPSLRHRLAQSAPPAHGRPGAAYRAGGQRITKIGR